MIKEFVMAWDANKGQLEQYFRENNQKEYDEYKLLVDKLFRFVINPYIRECGIQGWHYSAKFNLDAVTEIDDGDYQGTLIYVIPLDTCQPSASEYVVTYVDYGSCSCCDTLLNISGYGSGKPDERQIKDYMALCLHISQRAKWVCDIGEIEL